MRLRSIRAGGRYPSQSRYALSAPFCRFTHTLLTSQPNRDEDEESDNIERASLHQGHGTKISLESPVSSDFKGLRGPSSDPEDDVTPGERGCIETSILGQVEHISVQAQQNFLPSPKMKLRRPASRQQTERKTYGHRKPLEYQQHATKTRMPRRLPVNELELALDPVPSNPIYDSDGKLACIP